MRWNHLTSKLQQLLSTCTSDKRTHRSRSSVAFTLLLALAFFLPTGPGANVLAAGFTCTDIPADQCQALSDLHRATGGKDWTVSNWGLKTLACSWTGISCRPPRFGGVYSTVIAIDLANNNLSGRIDIRWQDLPALELLNLGVNQLSGSLPSSLGNLASLKELDLSNNQFEGALPATLGSLANLDLLNLQSNEFTGTIPVSWGSLSALTTLDVSSNSLIGEMPTELGNLTGLTWLNLRDNDFSGSLPETLVNLASLTFFYFDETYLCIPETTEFSDWLDSVTVKQGTGRSCALCRGPEIPGQPGTYRWDQQCLTLVSLYDATNGRHWFSSANWLSTSGTIDDWAGVTAIVVSGPHGDERRVFALELPGNNLTGTLPDLSPLDFMEILDLGDNAISGPLPESLGPLGRLYRLDLEQNQFSGSVPESYANLLNLIDLDLSDNPLSGALPQGFTALPLTWLDLSNTSICIFHTAEMDTWLATITYLSESGIACEPAIALDMTVTTDSCPGSDSIEVVAGTSVNYCYTVVNTGDVTLNLHDLVDSEFGPLLAGVSLELAPEATYTYAPGAIPDNTATHTGTWKAYNPGPTNIVEASDVATVTVIQNSISLDMTVSLFGDGCPGSDSLTVPAGTQVEYCYEVTNTGEWTLDLHHVSDNPLGTIVSNYPFELTPGASTSVSSGAVTLNTTTISTGYWTAYNEGMTNAVQVNDMVTVTVNATPADDDIFASGFEE